MKKQLLPGIFLLLALAGCKTDNNENTLFKKLSKEHHGIDFRNTISESDSLSILTLEYIYNGAGVGIGDFNNDGLSDIFLTGNMVPNKLYLNTGGLHFQDISEKAGIGAEHQWRSGVALADVNADGLLDIYVCATISKDSVLRRNILFINKGNDKDGHPTFSNEAEKYGVAYSGYSTNAAFVDYDNDGDLDLYILTNTIQTGIPTSYRPKVNDGSAINSDRLFRNNGNESFTDVSKEAGIIHEGYGLGLAIADINQDGWQDIYVSNDYITNDLLYINNRNGTFTNAIDQWIKHQSQFSMGNDIADINNDALPDIITLDMLPEGNLRRKTVIHGPTYTSYINNKRYGYAHQYIRNMLQVNNGNGSFSEVGQLAGVHQTEWSWSPLFVDFDNDGYRDIIVTNGFPRDITDKDFSNFRNDAGGALATNEILLDSVPVVKIPNYVFKNNGDLTFNDVTKSWGLAQPSFSNGAAFADFDNDGDLEYVVNNINDEIFFYENTLYTDKTKPKETHFLRLKIEGSRENPGGLGAKIKIHYGKNLVQYHDHSVYRGYLSSVENIVHFGLGSYTEIDSVTIGWPDGKSGIVKNCKADQTLTVRYDEAKENVIRKTNTTPSLPLFSRANKKVSVQYIHTEEDKIDFNVQRTLPHKFSQTGPGLAVADVNNDGLEDFYVGGSAGTNGTLWMQKQSGTFLKEEIAKAGLKQEEDTGILFFDADGDGDADLYVVSGSYEYPAEAVPYQDRLYRNNGKGKFLLDTAALPSTKASGSCVRACDFDKDGDLDLFVGGRVVPAKYPMPAESYLLVNENGKFRNSTPSVCPELANAGMITDALWTDYNNDGKTDLMVTGEFMAITVYENDGQKLSRIKTSGLEQLSGWWNSLTAADFDKDGDTDYVAGNLGLNNYYKASAATPLRVYAKDFDGNNSIDAVLTCYLRSEEGEMKEYPVHFWDELNSQSPKFRRKFAYYKKFGKASIDKLLTADELKEALILETNYTASSYIENLGNGKFKVSPLPIAAQVAPVYGILAEDIDGDGNTDLVLIGNDFGNEVFTGRHDALNGLVLKGNGKGQFSEISLTESGFIISGDGKALAKISGNKGDLFVATQNQDSLMIFEQPEASVPMTFNPMTDDQWAQLVWSDGKKQKVEFYWGSGYLSQSTRRINIPENVKEVVVYDSKGKARNELISERAGNR